MKDWRRSVRLLNLLTSKPGVFADFYVPCSQLGIQDDIGDTAFNGGMRADAENLGDLGTTVSGGFEPDWIPAFKQAIHGIIIVSGDCHETVAEKLEDVEDIFSIGRHDALMHEVLRIVGDVRPGKEKGHEQFVSQPYE